MSRREDEKTFTLTLLLDGGSGAMVSLVVAVVRVAVLMTDWLLAASIATIPNLYAVPLNSCVAEYGVAVSMVFTSVSAESAAAAGPR
jgi:hypothetical protein